MAIQETSAVSSAAANGKHGHSLISDEKFHQLYTLAVGFHLAAEQGMRSLAGREAAFAAFSAELHPGDVLVSEHPWPLIDSCGAKISSGQHATPQPVSATGERMVDALSAAVADRIRGHRRVTVLFPPEHGEAPLLAEARAVASGAKLPVIFVEQANEHAMTSRRRKAQKSSAPDELISIPVDGHDVIAMYRVAYESITRARQDSRPTRIICFSLPAVGGSDSQARSNDTVANLEKWLNARGLPVERWRQEIIAKRASRNSPEPQHGRAHLPAECGMNRIAAIEEL